MKQKIKSIILKIKSRKKIIVGDAEFEGNISLVNGIFFKNNFYFFRKNRIVFNLIKEPQKNSNIPIKDNVAWFVSIKDVRLETSKIERNQSFNIGPDFCSVTKITLDLPKGRYNYQNNAKDVVLKEEKIDQNFLYCNIQNIPFNANAKTSVGRCWQWKNYFNLPTENIINFSAFGDWKIEYSNSFTKTKRCNAYDKKMGIIEDKNFKSKVYYSEKPALKNTKIFSFPGFPSIDGGSSGAYSVSTLNGWGINNDVIAFQDKSSIAGTYMLYDDSLQHYDKALTSFIASKMTKDDGNIFFGGSKGGSIAIHYSKYFKNQIVISAVPQMDVFDFITSTRKFILPENKIQVNILHDLEISLKNNNDVTIFHTWKDGYTKTDALEKLVKLQEKYNNLTVKMYDNKNHWDIFSNHDSKNDIINKMKHHYKD